MQLINEREGGLDNFSRSYTRFGFNVSCIVPVHLCACLTDNTQVDANGDVTYSEWIPNSSQAWLIGDFSESGNV